MTKTAQKINLFIGCLAMVFLCGCVKDRDFNTPTLGCADYITATSTYSEIKNLYVDQTIQIQEDLVIEGYVISSDKAGNFFSVIHFQDKPDSPSEGLQIEIDLRDSHLFFDVGQHIVIKLKGLYLGKSKGVFKLGGVFSSFGNVSVGRLPNTAVFDHVLVACETSETLSPVKATIATITDEMVGTLVALDDVEIFIDEQERGTITGVLTQSNNKYQLVIRDLEDIQFDQERCEDVIDEFTSENIFFTELADPDNNAGARFVELYNSGSEDLSLKGWRLQRFTNANTEVSSTLSLSDYTIGAQETLVISPNATEFQNVYGFAPDVSVGTNSPADSNGDDNLQLVDPFGKVIDAFGVIGEDGSGTNHEFEDGKASRNVGVVKGNANYTFSEWILYNDMGENGTINIPQVAPNDFTPGIR